MKKNLLIGVLSLLLLTMIVFSYIKAVEAEKAMAIAQQQSEIAEEMAAKAEAHSRLATERAAEAQREKDRADSLRMKLEECKGN